MSSGYSGTSVTRKTKLLNFFAITDIHTTDKESPAQLIYLQQLNDETQGYSIYSGVMLYTSNVSTQRKTVNACINKPD
jgi:hypothetical protein